MSLDEKVFLKFMVGKGLPLRVGPHLFPLWRCVNFVFSLMFAVWRST